MSREEYQDGCPGCRPVVFKVMTGEPNAEATAIAERVYEASSRETKVAWHAVTCLNSRAPGDLALATAYMKRLQAALELSKIFG